MVALKITLVQCKLHIQPVPAHDGRGAISRLIQVLNVLTMKQEITLKEFSSLKTVKDTAERFTKPILQEYVVIFCIFRLNPNSVKKLFSSEACRSGARTSNSQFFVLLFMVKSYFHLHNADVPIMHPPECRI